MDVAGSGDFWIPQTPGVTVRGTLTAAAGENPELLLADGLIDDPRMTKSGHGATYTIGSTISVKAFLPITIQGRLDSGEFVTLINARNHGGPGYRFEKPRYEAECAIVGERTVSGPEQLFSRVRFRFGHPYWLGHLHDGENVAADTDGSALGVEAADDGNWFLYTSAAPATLRRFESLVVMGCVTLAELAFDQQFEIRDTQVRVEPDGVWLTVHGPSANTPLGEIDHHQELVPSTELTIERFANWLPVNDTLDGLGWAVARPAKAPLQTDVLVATALLEGLHRRLAEKFEQSKFPQASPSALNGIKQAARRAARDTAEGKEHLDPAEVHNAVSAAVGHFDDVDYLQRATDVTQAVCAALPEITESIRDLPKLIKDARNEMAHQVPLDHEKEPLEIRYLRWLIVSEATPWLLRGLLLLEAGINADIMHEQHLCSSRYSYFRANVAQFVEELGWELPARRK